MIAVIASQSIRESVRQLNRRNLFEVQDIDGHAPAELAAELEAGNYQYAIFDLLYFSGDVDLGLLLIRRIVETRPELTLIVVSDSLDEDSLFVEDVIKAGVPKEHIITNRQAGLRQQLLEIFLSDDILKSPAMDTAQPVANNSKGQDVSNSEEVHSEGPLSEGVPQEHPKQLERRAVAPSSRRCISVAVAGAGSGIGCTTQAMQLLLYCRAHGHHPALIEVHSAHSLQDYLGGGKAPNSDIIDETHFIIYGTDVYIGGKSAAKAREEHDILIFDYGNYSSIPDVTAYSSACFLLSTDSRLTELSLPHISHDGIDFLAIKRKMRGGDDMRKNVIDTIFLHPISASLLPFTMLTIIHISIC